MPPATARDVRLRALGQHPPSADAGAGSPRDQAAPLRPAPGRLLLRLGAEVDSGEWRGRSHHQPTSVSRAARDRLRPNAEHAVSINPAGAAWPLPALPGGPSFAAPVLGHRVPPAR